MMERTNKHVARALGLIAVAVVAGFIGVAMGPSRANAAKLDCGVYYNAELGQWECASEECTTQLPIGYGCCHDYLPGNC